MLSILIPTYNYNAYPLVLELQKQCLECQIVFEIICQDDMSSTHLLENSAINELQNCVFLSNLINLGRGRNINLIAEKAKFDWLLILDCDVYPTNEKFIKNYIEAINSHTAKIIFGGISYSNKNSEDQKLLRWVYGKKRESVSVELRQKKPFSNTLTSNIVIKKDLFLENPFDKSIIKYGYEDLCLLSVLKSKNIQIQHINNSAYHLNLETSIAFLEKTKIALENLFFIIDANILNTVDLKIIKVYNLVKKIRFEKLIIYVFNKFEGKIIENLLSDKPSLLLFDFYKLGYYFKINSKS
jgi:glycosyltransferase involved in cell wall biosynthesis